MKKFLPKSANNPQGFTLIELLVVISIIAVLSVIGFAVYNGVSKQGNDSRRQADIKAIADALEVKRANTAGATAYQTISASDFAGGVIPSEPTTRTEKYCYTDGTATIANPTVGQFTGSTCPNAGSGNGTGWMSVSGAAPTVSATATFFRVCTLNEAKTAVSCVGSKQ